MTTTETKMDKFLWVYSSTINRATFYSNYHCNGFYRWLIDGIAYGIYLNGKLGALK